jgi:hypothetical protein
MTSPEALRARAAKAREIAAKSKRPNFYLLALAERFDNEASAEEQRMAGNKPAGGTE